MESSQTGTDLRRNPAPRAGRSLAARIALWCGGVIVLLIIGIFIASFFLDGMIRPRLEAAMNGNLKGYHVTVPHAHLQLVGFRLTLKDLKVLQEAHPSPPVADFPAIHFHIYWRELVTGHVVATVNLVRPRIHINRPQLVTEAKSKTPLRERGWQDALQAAYPFKINRLSIDDGDVVYIDKAGAKPLHVANLYFVTDNIRNIHEPANVYPSRFWGKMAVFGKGRLKLDGRANYLMKPFPGIKGDYAVKEVPLSAVTPASRHVNMTVTGGVLSSEGTVEYSPQVTNVVVRQARIDSVDLNYIHLAQTQGAEKQRITKVGKTIKKENNRPAVNLDLNQLEIRDSRLSFKDEASNPPYSMFISNTNMMVTNLTNHGKHGLSRITLTGKFMGSGDTRLFGTFVAGGPGPEFAANIAIVNTDVTSLNPLLRAHGRFDVAQGQLTVYSQMGVRNGKMSGYVKPLFSNLKVYSPQKEKNKGFLQKAKEAVIGAAAHVLKNQKTKKVATEVSLNGSLKNPKTSTWEAFIEVVRNAFIKAILPGFDRQVNILRAAAAKAPKG